MTGATGSKGATGATGSTGATGAGGYSTLISKTVIPWGGACAGGGTTVSVGLDNGDGGGIARNGILEAGEVDSSANVCGRAPMPATYIFRADGYSHSAGELNVVLQRYAVGTGTWTTVTPAPSGFRSTTGSDGTLLYAYLANNTLAAYNVAADTWSTVSSTGPAANKSGFLRHTPGGVYYCPIEGTTMNRYHLGAWTSFTLPQACASSGTFDRSTNTLYVRILNSNSFMVIDSATGTVTTTVSVSGFHTDETTDGAYYAGKWYTQDTSAPIQWTNATTGGAPTDLAFSSGSIYPSMATDFFAGVIYISGWGDFFGATGQAFRRFDPVAGTVTNLADAPSGVIDESNLTVFP